MLALGENTTTTNENYDNPSGFHLPQQTVETITSETITSDRPQLLPTNAIPTYSTSGSIRNQSIANVPTGPTTTSLMS